MRRELGAVAFEFFDAYRISQPGQFTSPGAFGGFLSHVQVLAEAAAANESVLILEDDCAFLPEAWTYEPPACDVLWAGWEQRTARLVIGAQCVGYSAMAAGLASTYIRNLLDPAQPADPQAELEPDFNPRIRPPFDGCLMWFLRTHPRVSAEFVPLTSQRSSRSDITPGRFDEIPVLRQLLSFGRRLKELT